MSRSIALNGLAAVCLAVLPVSPALAQGDACLTFVDSIILAAQRAPEVDSALARQAEAEANLREVRSERHPQVSTFARSGVGDNGLTGSQVDNQVGLRLSQRVYDFGDSRLAREAALGQLHQQIYGVWAQQMQTAGIVADAYLSRLEADEMIDVISERRDYFHRQQSAVDDLLTRGGATRAESAQIAAQLAQAEAEVLELRFLSERATTRIVEYTGLSGEVCASEAADAAIDNYLNDLQTIDDIVGAALAHNPQVGARRSAIRSLEAARGRERRARLPAIDVVGIASYVYDDQAEDWEYRDRVGVDVTMPVLTGNRLGARRARADALVEQEESALRALQRSLREETEISFRRVMSLRAQMLRREAVAQSQEAYFDAIAGEFEFGLGTLPDLVEARLEHEQAQLDLVTTRYALMREKLNLMQLAARMPLPDGGAISESNLGD
jgi:outer membrane protein